MRLATPKDGTTGTISIPDEPDTILSKRLLELIQRMFEEAYIPDVRRTAEVVPILKKDSPTDMNDYQTMRLIPSIMKLLCAIPTNRIQRGLQERKFFAPEQAGFRSREECMSHALTHIEVAQRRSIGGQQPTYVCFIDFQKAFDTVPHEAPFLKMERAGVSEKCLAFFSALYADSWMRIRLGDCSRTPRIRIRRGLQQGDPASPLLFSIFINDLLNNRRQFVVEVPWIDCGEPGKEPSRRNRLAGCLVADDVVLLAPAPETLAASMEQVSDWADRWEMSIGASKCGVMVIHGDSQRIRNRSWRLQNQEIPIVEKYRYLQGLSHADARRKGTR